MSPHKDPIETMTPAEKLLRVGVIGGTALLLVLATVSSFRDGPGQTARPEVAEAPAAEEGDMDVASADTPSDTAPEPEEAVAEMAEAPAVPDAEDAPAEEDAPVEEMAEADPAAMEETDPAPAEEMAETDPALAEDAVTEVAEAPADPAPVEDTGPVNWLEESPLLASADIDAGESAFRQCSACHQYAAERNAGGPHLVGIVGRPVGAVDNWRYSDALLEAGGVWTPERLEQWLTNPDDYLPGNRMAYPGVRDAQERIDIIAFLAAQAQ